MQTAQLACPAWTHYPTGKKKVGLFPCSWALPAPTVTIYDTSLDSSSCFPTLNPTVDGHADSDIHNIAGRHCSGASSLRKLCISSRGPTQAAQIPTPQLKPTLLASTRPPPPFLFRQGWREGVWSFLQWYTMWPHDKKKRKEKKTLPSCSRHRAIYAWLDSDPSVCWKGDSSCVGADRQARTFPRHVMSIRNGASETGVIAGAELGYGVAQCSFCVFIIIGGTAKRHVSCHIPSWSPGDAVVLSHRPVRMAGPDGLRFTRNRQQLNRWPDLNVPFTVREREKERWFLPPQIHHKNCQTRPYNVHINIQCRQEP